MRKIVVATICMMLSVFLAPGLLAKAEETTPTFAEAFKDEEFRKCVKEQVFQSDIKDTDLLDATKQQQLAAVSGGALDIAGKEISDLTGIQYFTGLTELDCSDNQLSMLDVSALTGLTSLNASRNYLTYVNVTGLATLQSMNLDNNFLQTIDVSTNTALTQLYIDYNGITSFDMTKYKGPGLSLHVKKSVTTLSADAIGEYYGISQ